jgi:pimeloyl-ACP methyl ester carboxylesterase
MPTDMRVALVALLALLLGGCEPAPKTPESKLALTACRLPGVETEARCAILDTWEDREAKSGRRIPVRVAVVPAKLRAKEPDPIVVFAGGPGQGAIALAAEVLPLFAKLNDSRDIVLIDQRGTGSSNALDCSGDQPVQSLFEDSIPAKVVKECLARLDADPRQYTTTIAMADFDEIREGLGYAKLNLWGGSYGTRAALEYLRRYPDHVRTVTLDGVAPATMKLPLSFVADGDAALERLLGSCSTDALCESSYPRLRETLSALRKSLARRPVRAAIADPLTGDYESVTVTENVLLSGLFRPLYLPELASLLPFAITAAARGDFNPLLAQNFELADEMSENFSLGMHLSVICAEDVPRITPADLASLSKSFFGRALVDDFMRACAIWPKGKVPADYYDPVKADVPTLILSGGIDPATPPRHGALVASWLPRSKHFVAANLAHGVSLHGCAPKLLEGFIRKGDGEGLDGTCLERIPRPLFLMPLGVKPPPGAPR